MSIVAEVPVIIKALQVKPSVTNKEVYVSIISPFRNTAFKKYDKYYHILLANLEENRNRIIIKSGKTISPATDRALALLLDITFRAVPNLIRELSEAGIIGVFKIGNRVEYYMNPKYAFCGKEIPEFLMWMFCLKESDLLAYDTMWVARQKELEGCL